MRQRNQSDEGGDGAIASDWVIQNKGLLPSTGRRPALYWLQGYKVAGYRLFNVPGSMFKEPDGSRHFLNTLALGSDPRFRASDGDEHYVQMAFY